MTNRTGGGADDDTEDDRGTGVPRTPGGRRLLAVLGAGLVPWTVVFYPGGFDLLFSWGLFNTNPPHAVHLYDFLFRFTQGPASLPPGLLAWPVGSLLYAGALVSTLVGVALGVEDRRVSGGLLVCAGVSTLRVAARFLRIGEFVLPVGAVALFAVAWWFHARDFRGLVGGG